MQHCYVLTEADLFQIDHLSSVNHEILLLEKEKLQFSKRMGARKLTLFLAYLFSEETLTVIKLSVKRNGENLFTVLY